MCFIPLIKRVWEPAVQNTPRTIRRRRFFVFKEGLRINKKGRRNRVAKKSW